MWILQQLHNVYFDSESLCYELERFPSQCPFWQSVDNSNETCTVMFFNPASEFPQNRTCAKCLARLEALRCDILMLQQEIHIQVENLSPEDISQGLETQLFKLQNVLAVLNSLMEQIGMCLSWLPGACTRDNLEKFKDNNAKLQFCIHDLEKVL